MTILIGLSIIVILASDIVVLSFLKKNEQEIYDRLGAPPIFWNSPMKSVNMIPFILFGGFFRYKLKLKIKLLCVIQLILGWVLLTYLGYTAYIKLAYI